MIDADTPESKFLADVIAELRYGELRGSELVQACRSNPALAVHDDFFRTQAEDELRHAALLAEAAVRLPAAADVPSPWRALLDDALDLATSPQGVTVVHGIVESFVLADLCVYRAFWAHTAERDVFDEIARDEARHVAFGDRWLRLHARDAGAVDVDRRVAAFVDALGEAYARPWKGDLSSSRRAEFDALEAVAAARVGRRLVQHFDALGMCATASALLVLSP